MTDRTKQLKRHEGLRLKPYKDTEGKITIGYGHNLTDKGITKHIADMLFYYDLWDTCYQVREKLPYSKDLCEPRQTVLVNMAFNMGINGLLSFTEMLNAVKEKDFKKASKEMLNSKWAKQVGSRAEELAVQMKTGEYVEH